jgi:hypothetical protein
VVQDFDRDPESKVRRSVKIPVLDNIDPTPVRPDNKENIDTILDVHTKLQCLNFGGDGIHSNVEAEGERRKSPRAAAKQNNTTPVMKNDTTPAMKKDNENSKLQKIGVRFQTECSKLTNETDTFLKQIPYDYRPVCKCTTCLRFYDEDGTWNETKASIQVSSGLKSEPHTVGKQHNPSGELGSKTTSGESDQTVFDEYTKRHANSRQSDSN